MIQILKHPTYARLFSAQVVALLGTGLMTVALGLLAFDLAGDRAGAVLGTAYAIKMVAYVGLSPVMAAIAVTLPRKVVLICADLIRASVALALPFITEIWHIYALIFLLQAASATFTPVFQATIPDILPDEGDYTRALSLSRLAYDLENLLSPTIAALLLTVMSFHGLFSGTVIGFLISAALVLSAAVPPQTQATRPQPFRERLTRGSRIYLATPRLRGLLSLNLAVAAVGAFVLVNTVVLAKSTYGLDDSALAMAMAAFGLGSMAAALILPRLLDRLSDRQVMMPAGIALVILSLGVAAWMSVALPPWNAILLLWALIGVAWSAVLTPSGRLLRVSSHEADRPALFAAQFALSHACWLVTYPLAGALGPRIGLPATMAVLGLMALIGVGLARWFWPAGTPDAPLHDHPDLASDHPHMRDHGSQHVHVFVIDDDHHRWPTQG